MSRRASRAAASGSAPKTVTGTWTRPASRPAWLELLDGEGEGGTSPAEEVGPSWLTALRDPRSGTALSLMHDEPQRPWTVEGLARAVTMSRPAFARRFKELVGSSPLAYLARLRIDRAARMLRDTDDLVSDIAQAVGYTSEFAFSRAFSRQHGIAPGRYRRRAPMPLKA